MTLMECPSVLPHAKNDVLVSLTGNTVYMSTIKSDVSRDCAKTTAAAAVCRNATLQTLRYHYVLKVYVPIYHLTHPLAQGNNNSYKDNYSCNNSNNNSSNRIDGENKVHRLMCVNNRGSKTTPVKMRNMMLMHQEVDTICDAYNNRVWPPRWRSRYLRSSRRHPLNNLNLSAVEDSESEDDAGAAAAAKRGKNSVNNARVTDREEIRRRLAAAGAEEEYYGGERTYRKPGLGTRLQGAMNLQICFMNDPDAAVPGADQSCVDSAALQDTSTEASKVVPPSQQAKILPKQDDKQVSGAEQQEDFFQRQQRLQEEATMALAQVRPMAHMQLEIEKQNRKKSPIAEIIQVGIPGFCDGKKKKLDNMMLGDMNVAQLQVVVNDLHSQIESLNEELVRILVERDDLHMQQDSMLVNSEDLLARAQEYSMKVQSPKKGEKTQTKDRKR